MKLRSNPILTASLALTASIGTAFGGNPETAVVETPPAVPDWEYRLTSYGWLAGLDGTAGVRGLTAEVDEPFSELLEELKFAFALNFEARNGRWGVIVDGFYAEVGDSSNPPGPLYDYVDFSSQQVLGELYVAYRFCEGPWGFVDAYAGVRYNYMGLDLKGTLDQSGIQTASNNASGRIVNGIGKRADALAQTRIAAYQAAAAVDRAAIETQLTADIEAEANGRVKRDLERQLLEIRRDGGIDARDIASNRISRAVKAQRVELAASTAALEVAQLRASVDASLQGAVTQARSRVAQAEKKLASAINKQLVNRLPTKGSADEEWLDPIVGVRAQWNINEKYYLAAKSDIGGFDVGSEFTWTIQATIGHKFNERVSSELGYRYMHTNYTNGGFTYDVAMSGIYTSLNFKF